VPAPLVYDFYGFPERYYRVRYDSPGAPDLAAEVKALMPPARRWRRGGPWPGPRRVRAAHSDVSRCRHPSPPDLDAGSAAGASVRDRPAACAPARRGRADHGQRLHDHGLPFVHEYWDGRAGAPEWSVEFDRWAAETLERGDLDALFDFRNRAPGMPYAHRRSSISRRSSSPWAPPPNPERRPRSRSRATGSAWPSAPSRFAEKVGSRAGPSAPTSCFRPPAPGLRRRPATRPPTRGRP